MSYIIILIEGIASFISPCVLPMLPMYISYFAGQEKKTSTAVKNSIGFVIGFTIVFTLLGAFSNTLGLLIINNIKYINIVMGSIIILFGLHYMDILHIKILDKSKGISANKKDLTFFSSIAFGMIFSVCWTPCVGIFLSSALVLSASSESIVQGIIMLLIYSLGLGIPFIVTAIFLDKLKTLFDFIKRHYRVINKICGLILIISGTIIIFDIFWGE